MARNIEIRARIRDSSSKLEDIAAITNYRPDELWQEDIFFNCGDRGRLKLRLESSGQGGQLIVYIRNNCPGPRQSSYSICAFPDASSLLDLLTAALGVVGRVKKHRRVFKVGKTRLHLDEVELAAGTVRDFLVIEVVLDDDDSIEHGIEVAMSLMARLGIDKEQLVADSCCSQICGVGLRVKYVYFRYYKAPRTHGQFRAAEIRVDP